jgi:hypothetical protein
MDDSDDEVDARGLEFCFEVLKMLFLDVGERAYCSPFVGNKARCLEAIP